MKKLNYKFKINLINKDKLENSKILKIALMLIDIEFKFKKPFDKISNNSNKYIKNCFADGLDLIKNGKIKYFIKWTSIEEVFLNKKFLGMTEYLAKKI